MARDPKARVVNVGPFQSYTDPTYGRGAIRQILYEDGTVEVRFFHYDTQKEGQGPSDQGYLIKEEIRPELSNSWATRQRLENPPDPKPPAQTAEQTRRAQQEIEEQDLKTARDKKDDEEREYNFNNPGPDGRRIRETNAQRADREIRLQADARAEEARKQSERAEQRSIAQQEQANRLQESQIEISRGNLELSQQREQREANKPTFLSQAGEDNPFLIRYNPESGLIEQMGNPNFDRVKQESERLRSLLAVQIQAKNSTLETAKQQYQQWYDTNVKIPMLQAQEARDRAAEQRAALDADERRRQFAANFSLQKGELGQRAGAAAMQAEESLLPYRAGPTESAEMSSAINSLGKGGSMSTNASAGINFTPGAFEFDAPDFKSIAKNAAAAALKGISTYKPSSQQYQTANYEGIPAVNTSGAPSVPSGYGEFEGIINNLKSNYSFGGAPQG